MNHSIIEQNLREAQEILQQFISDKGNCEKIAHAAEHLLNAFRNGNKVISCGNGGSMCDAMHFAEELSGRFREDRKALPALSISDPSHLSCVANDHGYENVFSRYIEALGNKGDILLAISTSGNSPNILKAAAAAKEKGMIIISLTGKDGGNLAGLSDVEIRAPHSKYADRAQEIHIKVIHSLIHCVESGL
ncbi:MAG: D-sedoheptulose 7-phosphate isomerase [Bacteroidota bacterium]|nr:D-sedoheptulose 7-phosphate isomerase [Bacteroidota bacterium]